ncbi:hypothetical protein BRD17_01660 [Halobacteriales archaeon SW_7_68_16]|nr:MAG: hypothetical protein BRD17_01660 [Halobacteriales archaeon SW_7_68_16]
MDVETTTLTIETTDGETDEVTLPTGLLDMLKEDDETDAYVAGDLVSLGVAQRIHGVVHHGSDDPDEELVELESAMMELFEERFDQSFSKMVGHSH